MADSGGKFLTKMLERLYASMSAGPALNCRPHNSRQRIDLRLLTRIAGTTGEAVLAGLLDTSASIKLASTRPRGPAPSADATLSEAERAERKAWEDEQSVFQKLRLIADDAKAYEQEVGHQALYIGYPLLHLPPGQVTSGRFGATKRILAPVAFIPVKLVVKTGRVPALELACAGTGADRVIPNVALLAWIEQQTGVRFEELFADEEGVAPWRELNELTAAICKSLGLAAPAELTPTTALVATPRSDDEDSRQSQVLPAAVLGLYPLSNQSLIRDMEAMVAGESLAGPVESFLLADLGLGGPSHAREPLAQQRRFDQDRLVGAADPCQARAVRMARESRGLVIHGPPGTGKSQTIANVIGDHLARGERVLFVCDKRTALDVVMHRLTHLGLGKLCAIVHDAHRDQRDLYIGVREQLDGLPESKANDAAIAELAAADQELANIHEQLTTYDRALSEPPSEGELSLHGLMGEWLATKVPEAAELGRPLDQPPLAELAPHEKHVREILARAQKEGFPSNPWRGIVAIDLSAFLAKGAREWRDELDALAEAARAVDAVRTEHVAPFADAGDAEAEGRARAELAEALAPLAASEDGKAALAAWARRDEAAVAQASRELETLAPQLATIATPLDAELSLVQRAQPVAVTDANVWLVRLIAYLQIASKWYRFFLFGARRRAREVVQRFGLALNAAAAERVQAFLEGVRARRVLQSWYESNGLGSASDPLTDGPLQTRAALQRQALAALARLSSDPALASCRASVQAALLSPESLPNVVDGLKRSAARGAAIARVEALLARSLLYTSELRHRVSTDVRRGINLHLFFHTLAGELPSLEGMIRIRHGLAALPAPLAVAVEQLGDRSIDEELGWRAVRKSVLAAEVRRRLSSQRSLQEVDGDRLHAYHNRFRALEQRKRELVRDAIVHHWTVRQRQRLLATTGTRLNAGGAELRRRLTLRGERAMRVRQVIASGAAIEGGDPLFDLRPVWMASPDTVAQIFPRAPIFDVVVFDEASQCRLEEALPVLTRAKRVVIAGDPKQLPPTRFFESTVTKSEESEAETDQELFEEQQSDVEDLLAAALNLEIEQCYLDVHYRSRNADLIEFSNQSFYDSRLQAIPGHPSRRAPYAPLRLVRVAGTYDKRANLAEAQTVVGIVRQLLARPEPPSVGIACFNLTQREAILNALDEAATNDPEFAARLATARNRRGAASFEGLFVKNLENVQGDERDHLIISTTYGPDPKGRFYRRFGPLGRAGGGRRLNVLVTRARDEVHLVTSIPAELYRALPPMESGQTPNGAWLLFSYLNYAERLAAAYEQEAQRLAVAKVAREVGVHVRESPTGSRLAVALAERLADEHTLSSDVHWGNEGFCVDVALHHPSRAEDVTVGILCDSTRFDKTADRIEWDLFRTSVLEATGWSLIRLWTPQFFRDPEHAIASVVRSASDFMAKEAPKQEPQPKRIEPSLAN